MTATTQTAADWQPGDPLWPGSGSSYRQHLYNFRDDSESEECRCSDAASWPEPGSRTLGNRDELGDFIDRWHAWRRSQLEVEGA